jgi:predicted transposase/invertase (TIGR01784 family)
LGGYIDPPLPWFVSANLETEEEFMANATFPETRAVLDDVKQLSSSQDMRYAYFIDHIAHLDHNTDIHYAKEEGSQQSKREIAQAMLKAGEQPEKILSYTGLTPDQLS